MIERLRARLTAPRDPAALVAFRIALGLLVTVSAVRFLAYGWIDDFFVRPRFQFKYWGFGWVEALPAPGMHLVFVALAVLGVSISVGLFYRAVIAVTFVLFTYVQLIDVTNYLNHYYLLALLLALMFFVPAHRAFSLDVWRRPGLRAEGLPAWCTYLLRFQVAVVYVNAGLAKLNADWLLHAQPLNLWLAARTDLPIVGPWMDQRWVAYVAAWFGFLFDTTIVAFLLFRRTRAFAYAAVLVFHGATMLLFPIGLFPVIMSAAALVFFDSSWPRRFLPEPPKRQSTPNAQHSERLGRPLALWWFKVAAAIYALLQIALPLRTHLYGGNVLWHEQGMRFSWRVMAREKNGSVSFEVRDPRTDRRWLVSPSAYLNPLQEREMSTQPDLVLQLAQHIARDFAARGHHNVEVRADALASLNGRPAAPLIDPAVNLAAVHDGLRPKPWITAAPDGPPLHLRPSLAGAR